MLFHSFDYLLFFVAVFALYWAVPWQQFRVWLLVGASVVFYCTWSWELALVVVATASVNWLIGLGLGHFSARGTRRALVVSSVLLNLGVLCYFKYTNFFLESLYAMLERAGWPLGDDRYLLNILAPLGISFFTFEAISYAVDVYKGKCATEKRYMNFMLFILFFPHLIAGPIVRAGHFLPQTYRRKTFDWLRMQLGVQLFLMGLVKKMAIADRMAIFSNEILGQNPETKVFADPSLYSTGSVWIGVLAFAVRIYCDFSGYTDMAIGTAHMLGYKLTANFNMPYISKNVSEFWRRWHISLSTWLRDYLFIPLGGSRGSTLMVCRNLMITMTLGGLWHGANWTFIIWGILHGLLLVGHRLFSMATQNVGWWNWAMETWPGIAFRRALTFFCVMLCWVFFQPSMDVALAALNQMFVYHDGLGMPINPRSLWYILAFVALCHWIGASGAWVRWYPRIPAPVMGVGYAAALTLALLLFPGGEEFIYFQF